MEKFSVLNLIFKEKKRLKKSSIKWILLILCNLIRITHRNVLRDGFDFEESINDKIDAVFLDLPSPEKAVILAD